MNYYLFANPSFIEGASRALDLGGTFNSYNRSRSASEADFKAIKSDWDALKKDFQNAEYLIHQEKNIHVKK